MLSYRKDTHFEYRRIGAYALSANVLTSNGMSKITDRGVVSLYPCAFFSARFHQPGGTSE